MTPCKHGWDDIRKCVVCTPQGGDLPPDVEKLIRAARLEALEEAAKIAEGVQYVRISGPAPGAYEVVRAAQEEIAAAIRERAKA